MILNSCEAQDLWHSPLAGQAGTAGVQIPACSPHQQQHDETTAGTSASLNAPHNEREVKLHFECLNSSKDNFSPLAFFWPFKPISQPCKAGGVPSAKLEKDRGQRAQNTWLTEMKLKKRLAAVEISRNVETRIKKCYNYYLSQSHMS